MLKIKRLVTLSLILLAFTMVQSTRVAAQDPDLEEAVRLSKRLLELQLAGRYDEAIPLAERALAILEKSLGPEHPVVANSLSNLGELYRNTGDYKRAEQAYLRALAIQEKTLGAEHLDTAVALDKLASLYRITADYVRAEPLFQRALAIREKTLGPNHPALASSLVGLGDLYRNKGDYERAELMLQRALAIREKGLGPDNPEIADPLNTLALLYTDKGDYDRAEPLYVRALAIREKALGPDHRLVATSLNNLAELYFEKGDYERAEPLYQRSQSIYEKVYGPEHPNVAASLNNLAMLYFEKGDYERAELPLQRALAIREKVLGPNHPDVAASLNNLAGLYRIKGNYVRAEPLFLRALEIREKALGPDHPDVAVSLNNLAALYLDKGDEVRAERLYQRALVIKEKVLGPEHPKLAGSLNNVALFYFNKGDYERAESLFQRSINIQEKTIGRDHPGLAFSLNNLAEVYKAKGDYVRAELMSKRALEVREKALGPNHPDVAISLNGLAGMYYDRSDYARAEPLYQRAIAIREEALGPDHPDVATSLGNLGALHEAKGDLEKAMQSARRVEDIQEHNLGLILSTGSESQKQLYLNTVSGTTYSIVSLHARLPKDQQAGELAMTTILRRKGRALDVMTDQINALRQRATPEDQKLLAQLASIQSQLAKLRLSGADTKDPRTTEQRLAEVARLATESENIQAEVSRRSAEFRLLSQPVTLEAVQQAVPADAALVEIFSYLPFDAKAKATNRYGAPRYVAYVLKQTGTVTFVELGPAAAIDRAAEQFLEAISNPASGNVKEAGRALDEMIARPIRKLLGNVHQLLISPDSKLNLVPFAALVDEQGKYLVENYTITYLTSGRDLLRMNVTRQSKQAPMVMANPAFDLAITGALPELPGTAAPAPGNRAAANQTLQSSQQQLSQSKPVATVAGGRRSGSMLTSNWRALAGTAEEADYLKKLLPDARILTGKDATESALKQVIAPRILHLATHGFFLPDEAGHPNDKGATVRENPLLRSGLVLAGANNLQGGGGEDGILTALEAAGLNLWGTQLVVMSACETGVGDVRSGEGVYGLRRALVLAGTESQVMTLWKVDDAATSEVIIDYYSRLQKGEGRTEGLRQVQLEFLKRQTRQHPFYWAGFILNGDWRSLREKN